MVQLSSQTVKKQICTKYFTAAFFTSVRNVLLPCYVNTNQAQKTRADSDNTKYQQLVVAVVDLKLEITPTPRWTKTFYYRILVTLQHKLGVIKLKVKKPSSRTIKHWTSEKFCEFLIAWTASLIRCTIIVDWNWHKKQYFYEYDEIMKRSQSTLLTVLRAHNLKRQYLAFEQRKLLTWRWSHSHSMKEKNYQIWCHLRGGKDWNNKILSRFHDFFGSHESYRFLG